MKETSTVIKDKLEVVVQKEIEKQEKFLGKIRVMKGLTMYTMSMDTGEILPAKFEDGVVDFNNPEKIVRKLIQLPRHMYVQALNDKNAKRKFTKMVNELTRKVKRTTVYGYEQPEKDPLEL